MTAKGSRLSDLCSTVPTSLASLPRVADAGGVTIEYLRRRTALTKAGLVAGRNGHVFHDTRRGAISMHADLGLDEQLSMAITGHRDPGVHRRYRQIRKQQILAAQKVLSERLLKA